MNPDEIPVYAVRLSEPASLQVDTIFKQIEKSAMLETAEEWLAGFRTGLASLATLPERCLKATEDRFYQVKHPGPTLRVYLYQGSRSAWRVLFTVHTALQYIRQPQTTPRLSTCA